MQNKINQLNSSLQKLHPRLQFLFYAFIIQRLHFNFLSKNFAFDLVYSSHTFTNLHKKQMKTFYRYILSITFACSLLLAGCKKDVEENTTPEPPPPPPPPVENVTVLKEAVTFPVGVAISYTPYINTPAYSALVKKEFDAVTFDYHMKHGAIIQNNGSFDFTRTDALVQSAAPLQIFGHTLAWHANQNASYLKNFAGIVTAAGSELLSNGGFEDGLTNWSTFNTGDPAGTATVSAGSGSAEVRTGNGSLKVINPTPYANNQWRVQVSSSAFTTTPGKQYTISYWVKAATAGGSIRLSTGPTGAQYQGDQTIGTAWQQVSWTITATLASTTFLFDMGQVANTYYIDDASVKEVVESGTGGQINEKLNQALESYVTTMVTRYKGKVSGWDVVNELFTENGSIRNNQNTDTKPADIFVWSHYLGKDYAQKAFEYAAAADPAVDLYINDYNLEISPAKLNAVIAFATELKGKGVKIDGIGTQMHVMANTSFASIDQMFQKLAATGLKVRVSELDVRANTQNKPAFVLDAAAANAQSAMYKHVAQSYIKHVPAAQRGGITVWGLTDNTSWLYDNGADLPLLFDNQYNKKAAYTGFMNGLRGL